MQWNWICGHDIFMLRDPHNKYFGYLKLPKGGTYLDLFTEALYLNNPKRTNLIKHFEVRMILIIPPPDYRTSFLAFRTGPQLKDITSEK